MTWIDEKLDRLLDRVTATETEVGERFPLSADPATGLWKTTRRGSWTAGFWVGQLWLRARLTGLDEHRVTAGRWTARLAEWTDADTVTRGLIFWYGAAAAKRLGVDSAHAGLARRAALALASTFDEASAVLPWGTAFGDVASPPLARTDGAAGAVPLLSWVGEKAVAASHLRTHVSLAEQIGGNAWTYVSGKWGPSAEPPPGWTRGDAWLLLSLADGSRWLDPALAEPARQRLAHLPRNFPAVRGIQGSPPDSSAAVITAVAMAKLGLLDEAADLVKVQVRDHVQDDRLWDGCHDLSRGVATAHQLVWGDFFLLLALAILAGRVPADAL
ncbi:hypothetical protein ACFQ05_03285 [Amycolatopsis umgeniensis]|uniref:Unsaturated chondroitin disaccharide hydrolase n=1 Tax=Amycolatopsis umgeniensis TaxID=336628 RepID=A0A841B1B9_9PSEU|nr:sugar ABC transporter permease [Amycolatopsis umgeniensis]MBB5852284.1 unsaturated chondroitin disaccharide hydrolase [Amycolatopsis umgeniensis]